MLDNVSVGTGFALRLILNVEQYEYTIGPNEEMGVKVIRLLASSVQYRLVIQIL